MSFFIPIKKFTSPVSLCHQTMLTLAVTSLAAATPVKVYIMMGQVRV